jgi:hypothetical protein
MLIIAFAAGLLGGSFLLACVMETIPPAQGLPAAFASALLFLTAFFAALGGLGYAAVRLARMAWGSP